MSGVVGPVENAEGERSGTFPAEWGVPRGSQFSEERAAWVASHARREYLERKRTPAQRRAYLERMRRP